MEIPELLANRSRRHSAMRADRQTFRRTVEAGTGADQAARLAVVPQQAENAAKPE